MNDEQMKTIIFYAEEIVDAAYSHDADEIASIVLCIQEILDEIEDDDDADR